MVWLCEFLDGLYGILLYILAFVALMFLPCVLRGVLRIQCLSLQIPQEQFNMFIFLWIHHNMI